MFASPFFNAAIGRLLKDIKSEDLNRLLKVSNLVPAGYAVLRRVIENSKQYYSDDNTRSKAVDAVLLEQLEQDFSCFVCGKKLIWHVKDEGLGDVMCNTKGCYLESGADWYLPKQDVLKKLRKRSDGS